MSSRKLFILRHAQADAPPGTGDKDRPLSASGHRDANAVIAKMNRENLRPDLVLCSPARRTRETFGPVRALWPDVKAQFPDHLYLASAGDLYETIKQTDDAYKAVLLIGHNPGVHGLVQLLSGAGAPELMARLMTGYQTGSLSVLDCAGAGWADLMPGACRLTGLFIGKELT